MTGLSVQQVLSSISCLSNTDFPFISRKEKKNATELEP